MLALLGRWACRPARSTEPVRAWSRILTTAAKVTLRDYQEECIRSVLVAVEGGHKRLGISLATGSGKTVIFTQLISRMSSEVPTATRTLILAHRRELVEQAAKHCTSSYPDLRIEIDMGNIHASGTADITIASIQSITSRNRLDKYDPARFKLVLVDEAHHIVAPGYLKTLGHFGLEQRRQESPVLVGVSATFGRFDGVALGAAIDQIVYHKDYVDMISEKWLSDVVFTTVDSAVDLTRVKNGANGDFNSSDLSRVVNTSEINEITVRSWMAKAGDRKSTLVFCVDLAHVASLTNRFIKEGFDARFVTGDSPKVERGETLEAFRRGEFPILVNCAVFTEGTDIPNIDCVILARPTKSRNLLVQMIGRGMRLAENKTNCHVIDMVSSLSTGIVTTPTLFGLDPAEIVQEASAGDLLSARDRREAEAERKKAAYAEQAAPESSADVRPNISVTFTDYSSVLDLIADTSGEKHVRAISPHAWVHVGPDRYILSGPSGSYLRIERVEPNKEDAPGAAAFRAVEVRALPWRSGSKVPYAAPREILQASTFVDAVHGCDSYASGAFPRSFIGRDQPWRHRPATPAQLEFLNKIRGNQEPLTTDTVTMGQAGDMITKLKHGAKGRFARIASIRRQQEQHELRLERNKLKQLRERVAVGPVLS